MKQGVRERRNTWSFCAVAPKIQPHILCRRGAKSPRVGKHLSARLQEAIARTEVAFNHPEINDRCYLRHVGMLGRGLCRFKEASNISNLKCIHMQITSSCKVFLGRGVGVLLRPAALLSLNRKVPIGSETKTSTCEQSGNQSAVVVLLHR